MLSQLADLSSKELHPEVRSQLAATCKRLEGEGSVTILKNLILNQKDTQDPDLPLQLWWALESKSESHRAAVLSIFENQRIWSNELVLESLLKKLMQRYVMAAGKDNYAAAATLVKLAPSSKESKILIDGIHEGLRGTEISALPAALIAAIEPYRAEMRQELLAISLRQGDKKAFSESVAMLSDTKSNSKAKINLIQIIGEINNPAGVPALLNVAEDTKADPVIRIAALQAVQRFDDIEIASRLIKSYHSKLRGDLSVREATLNLFATRVNWALQFLKTVDRLASSQTATMLEGINKDDVSLQVARQFQTLNNPVVTSMVERIWPSVRMASSSDKNNRINKITRLVQSAQGDPGKGRGIYIKTCGSCHKLFDEGGTIGPELTGYDRRNLNDLLINIIDPNAYIREGYLMNQITTKDGRTIMGTIKSREGNTITLQSLSGEQEVIGNDKILSIQESKSSLMPERLLDGMSDKETIDFFSYLMKQQKQM
jgi:putative heme-binding domain-containing protein